MIRYAGQKLPKNPRIAVIANDALGNFVMATPLLQLLRQHRKPSKLAYYGGTRTLELQEASDLADETHALHGADSKAILGFLKTKQSPHLVINLENTALSKTFAGLLAGEKTFVAGPCMGEGGRGDLAFAEDDRGKLWSDKDWVSPNLTKKYPFLRTGFISEIFCRLCYLEGQIPGYEVPSKKPKRRIPEVLVATAASLPEKLWSDEGWTSVLVILKKRKLSVGLIGAKPSDQSAHWLGKELEDRLIKKGLMEDLRGEFTLPEVVGALSKARAVLSLDNGILHLAVAAGTKTVGLYRHGIHRLWAPPSASLTVLTAGAGRQVSEITPEVVWEALENALG